ncbi:M28 family peptidase [Alteromonas aestuariivivens]|nr:M28 family peptidase [Alteromonas aestuariivivens]
MLKLAALLIFAPALSFSASAGCLPDYSLLTASAITDLRNLSADVMGGRKPGTEGHERARNYLLARYKQLSLEPFKPGYLQRFSLSRGFSQTDAYNVVGWIPGQTNEQDYIVITAHYDHIGGRGTRIFNGADDNASGVSALLALAAYFTTHTPEHSLVFVATDAEEAGLKGSQAFLAEPPVPVDSILLNINLDMLGNGGRRGELFAFTSRHSHQSLSDWLTNYIQGHCAEELRLKKGRSRQVSGVTPAGPKINWRKSSDHYSFDRADIPYLYFGTSVHQHYHQPSDDFQHINAEFYQTAVTTVIQITALLDGTMLNWAPEKAPIN